MPDGASWKGRRARLMNRVHARAVGHRRVRTELLRPGEPHLTGSVARGRQLMAGSFLFAGHLVVAQGRSIWDLPQPFDEFTAELHGFTWLDDLAAVGDRPARAQAGEWARDWVRRFGRGRGPGWMPTLTGRRVIRLLNHADLVLDGEAANAEVVRCLARQTLFLSRRWRATATGLPRFEALTGLIHGALSLRGLDHLLDRAQRCLVRECGAQIGADGTVPTRNPEELAEIFTLLTWAAEALTQARRGPGMALAATIEAVAPTLRGLRQSDGALARFHGGGRGVPGRLDQALFLSGVRGTADAGGMAMGFSRLNHARTSVIVDTAPPPRGEASHDGHASTLAFELTSGRRPVVVNCGPGAAFGESWHRAGRATASHSTLAIDGWSSARVGPPRGGPEGSEELLIDGPHAVPVERSETLGGSAVEASHDGYVTTHGLVHLRRLELSHDGRALAGEDTLTAVEPAHRRRFDRMIEAQGAIPYAVRFHLHSSVGAGLDAETGAARLVLPNGEAWHLRATEGRALLRVDESVYLEPSLPAPRASRQVVLFCSAVDYSTRIAWVLAKTEDTPLVIRDVQRDEPY